MDVYSAFCGKVAVCYLIMPRMYDQHRWQRQQSPSECSDYQKLKNYALDSLRHTGLGRPGT